MTYKLIMTQGAEEDIRHMIAKRGEPFRKQVKKALSMLIQDLKYPGLEVHGLKRWPGWKEAKINKADRLVFRVEHDEIQVVWCGDHQSLDRDAFGSSIIQAEQRFKEK